MTPATLGDALQLEWLADLLAMPIAEPALLGEIAADAPGRGLEPPQWGTAGDAAADGAWLGGRTAATGVTGRPGPAADETDDAWGDCLAARRGPSRVPAAVLADLWRRRVELLRPPGMSEALALRVLDQMLRVGGAGPLRQGRGLTTPREVRGRDRSSLDVLALYGCLARVFLTYDGESIRLCQEGLRLLPFTLAPLDALELWRRLGILIGSDLLPALFFAQQSEAVRRRLDGRAPMPNVFCSRIESGLIQAHCGLPDCHIHANSAFRCELAWPSYLETLGDIDDRRGPVPLIRWLSRPDSQDPLEQDLPLFYFASVLRLVLALWLLEQRGIGVAVPQLRKLLDRLTREDRRNEAVPPRIPESAAAELVDLVARGQQRLRARRCTPPDEPWLMAAACVRLLADAKPAPATEIAWVFWTYVQIKARFHRPFIQQPGLEGLEYFQRVFDRAKAARLQSHIEASAIGILQHLSPHGQVSYVELRCAPDLGPLHLEPTLERICRAEQGDTPGRPGMAAVVHFVKWRPLGPDFAVADALAEIRAQASDLKDFLRFTRRRHLYRRVVGLDVAGPEQNRPNWLYLPLFAEMRPWWRETFGCDLGFSFHAGEDFLHLTQGLRHIAEVVTRFPWRRGDRIGHALALGYDPALWQAHHPAVVAPADQQLFDLIFEWSLITEGEIAPVRADGYLRRIERAILTLGPDALGPLVTGEPEARAGEGVRAGGGPEPFGTAADRLVTVEDYALFYQGLFCPRLWLRGLGTVNPTHWHLPAVPADPRCREVRGRPRIQGAILTYLQQLHRRGPRNLPYPLRRDLADLALERERLGAIQAWLVAQIKNRGIALEACPTSNLLIRRLPSMRSHPLLALADRIPILINTDNPSTFATDLAVEYRIVYEAALDRSGDVDEALRALKNFIENGHRFRFGPRANGELFPCDERGSSRLDPDPRRRQGLFQTPGSASDWADCFSRG